MNVPNSCLNWWKARKGLVVVLLLHVIASYYYIGHQDITFDEPQYFEYAKRWLRGNPERVELLDDSKSPIVAIAWLPRIVRQLIDPNYQLDDFGRQDQQEGRYLMIFFSLVTALYVYKWCKDWYGKNNWILPLVLLLFDPLYLSYATIITTDLACGTFLVATLYHFRKFLCGGSKLQFALFAFFSGLAIVTKQNMLFLGVLLPFLAIWYYSHLQEKPDKWHVAGYTIVYLVSVIVIINLTYYFYNTGLPFGDYRFESYTLQQLQQKLTFLHNIPVPLPQPYIQSIDMLKAHAEYGAGKPLSTYNGVYLFGELNTDGGYWYYYLIVLLYKMPLGIMAIFTGAAFVFVRKFNYNSFLKNYLFLVVPICFYWVVLSFFNEFQTGIRHLLLVFPLAYIGLGRLFTALRYAPKGWRLATAAVILYAFISVGSYYPYLIAYTNELIPDKKFAYKIIVDSSLEYGQSDSGVQDYIQMHPEYKGPVSTPDTGKFAVVVDDVVNLYWREKNRYNWYQKLEPTGVFRYVVLLYHVKEKDLVDAGLWKRKE